MYAEENMSKNKTKYKKKQAQLRAEKRRERLKNIVFVITLVVCISAVVCVPMLEQTKSASSQTWYVKGGTVEIAALPMNQNYAPSAYTMLGNAASGMVQTLPIQTGRPLNPTEAPTAEPTAEPTVKPTPVPTATPVVTPTPAPTVEIKTETITITAVGDCTLGGDVPTNGDDRFDKYVQRYGYDYFLANVRPLFEADDLTIVNLEGPLTTSKKKRSGRAYNFRGKPEYANILSGSSVEIANMANNHALDYGESGLMESVKVLTQAGIGVSGFSRSYTTEIKGITVTSIGFTRWDYSEKQVVKAVAAARKNCDLLIVSMHWGNEGEYETTSAQRSMGHAIIDAGADVVLGHHTHVYGGVEQYKGKYIVYSLGNFCFGGNGNPRDKRCLIFQQTFNVDQFGNVSDGGINIIPALVSGSDTKNNFQPVIMPAAQGASLLKKVAKESVMSMSNTVWMADSYMEKLGIVNQPVQETVTEEKAV